MEAINIICIAHGCRKLMIEVLYVRLKVNGIGSGVNCIMFSIIDIIWLKVYNRKHKSENDAQEGISVKKAAYNIVPATEEILKTMGEQIKLARLRRDLPAELVAERAGISRSSLWKVESGNPAVAMGIYAAVLHALNNMDKDLLLVAKDDEMGRKLQDLNLMTRKRATRRKA